MRCVHFDGFGAGALQSILKLGLNLILKCGGFWVSAQQGCAGIRTATPITVSQRQIRFQQIYFPRNKPNREGK
jgi:hypothetical protein